MKFSISVLVLMMLASNALATAQFPDILIYKGKPQPVFSNPLESYFGPKNPRPAGVFRFSCTAVWRGYVATWEIVASHLYLVKLVKGTCAKNPPEIPVSMIFPDQQPPVKATWFSGILRVPLGKRLQYVHMGYGSTYAKELLLTIEKGAVVKEQLIDNTDKKLPSSDTKALEELRKLKEWEDTTKAPLK